MLFIEFRFFFFFLIIFSVYWTLKNNTARKVWLLACSHIFYACFFVGPPGDFFANVLAHKWKALPAGWWFPFVLIGSTCMDYIVGRGIEGAGTPARKRAWVLVTLAINLGVLAWFKYFNFFVISTHDFLAWMGLNTSLHTLKIILPYGVSFYTFQSMSYTLEVYRGHLRAERRFLDLAFFIGFFPPLVAGPIVRAMSFLPQTKILQKWSSVDVRGALVLFLAGFVKKSCVAENVAPFVDAYFKAPGSYTALSAWIAVLLYAVQIYCDFSGYTDMAIAVARLLGYELTPNFNFPYLAKNLTDFWRRWHMSLSTWLRDYLYISLGGNRGSKWFVYRNLMLTMVLGGLWHGAAWTFVFWGTLHGLGLILCREWGRIASRMPVLGRLAGLLGVPLTFYWVCIAWVFFRAQSFADARTVLRAFVGFGSDGIEMLSPRLIFLLAGLGIVHWIACKRFVAEWWRRLPAPVFAAALGVAVAVVLPFVPTKYAPFIYFQF
jgi:alginate O-acetyltransferase complex protein AlgI